MISLNILSDKSVSSVASAQIHTLLIYTFVSKLFYYMAWPFVTVILAVKFEMSNSMVGITVSASAFLAVVAGFFAGAVSDKIGRKLIIFLGCLFSAIGFLLLATANHEILVSIALLFIGLGYSYTEVPIRAHISDLIDDWELKEKIVYLRYFLVNTGAAIGPIIGFLFGINASIYAFIASSFVSLLFGVLLLYIVRDSGFGSSDKRESSSRGKAYQVVLADKSFIVLVLVSFCSFLIFAQLESTFPLFLNAVGYKDTFDSIALMIAINALTVLCAQYPTTHLLRKTTAVSRVLIGLAFVVLSFSLVQFIGNIHKIVLVVVVVLFSIGEVIVLPSLNILLEIIAKPPYKGTYFGAASVVMFGTTAAPLVGGVLLDFSLDYTFLILALLSAFLMLMQYKARRLFA